jgi:hypothetical protein
VQLKEIKSWRTKLNFGQIAKLNPKSQNNTVSFKWNDMFWSKRRHFFPSTLKKKKRGQTRWRVVWICSSSSSLKAARVAFFTRHLMLISPPNLIKFACKQWPDIWLHASMVLSGQLTPQGPRRRPKVANLTSHSAITFSDYDDNFEPTVGILLVWIKG